MKKLSVPDSQDILAQSITICISVQPSLVILIHVVKGLRHEGGRRPSAVFILDVSDCLKRVPIMVRIERL